MHPSWNCLAIKDQVMVSAFSCLELNVSPYKPKPYKYLMLSTFTTFQWRGKKQFPID